MPIYRGGTPARVYKGGALAAAVYKGDVAIWLRDPQTQLVSVSGTVVAPAYAAFADVAVIGGGGGGATGNNGLTTANGKGGYPAEWVLSVGVPVKPGDVFTVGIGTGGAGGARGAMNSGSSGTTTTVTGALVLAGPGGAGATATTSNQPQVGHGPAAATLNGHVLPNGGEVQSQTTGSTPGGGGGGGNYPGWLQTPAAAGTGGPGMAVVRFRSY